MDFQSILTIIFFVTLALILYYYRSKLVLQKILFPVVYMLMWRSQVGIKLMKSWSEKAGKFIRGLSYIGIVAGFGMMVVISYFLIENLINSFTQPSAQAGVALVLPFETPVSIYVPFLYWIISLSVIVIVHEFSHGVVAKSFKIPIKSSGLAFLGIIVPVLPAAFVEPDEKKLAKKPVAAQLAVFAAGPFSNFIFGFIAIGILLFGIVPLFSNVYEATGVDIVSVSEGPAKTAGITKGLIINKIDNIEIKTQDEFINNLANATPGQIVVLSGNESDYSVTLGEHPENASRGYLGIQFQTKVIPKEGYETGLKALYRTFIQWLLGLFRWIAELNIAIGAINLLPIHILDGGRMVNTVFQRYFKKPLANRLMNSVGLFFLIILIVNIATSFF